MPGTRLAAVALVVCVPVLAGCTAELPEQRDARELVELHIAQRSGYDGEIHCTRNPRPWFVGGERANLFICAAQRDDGDCDWYRVDVASGSPRVTLDRDRGGCVLPK